ncbi:PREDICTED: uncharacterized protein At4g04775-like [Camelina sativa]|uniref:Uncharacterized protein At4g04775-like n=1 Tax=Camelina sativa TaxID=90675 RepID=A0ABM0ZC68_CAMSA|nr:PREDICTED: uncharacterized protein At4g04775-like [Camelina sativa]XP_010513644.1 PREDICTED: uncharacterized protein At4g04775-like [Camelina sativa]
MSQRSSAGSSGLPSRSSQVGVPCRCWCGGEIRTYTSKTEENPCRRFYRCVVGVKEKKEKHMFRWVDDAVLEEIRMVESKQNQLLEDLKKMVPNNVELQKEMVKEMEEKMEKHMIEIIRQELMVAKESMEKSNKQRICVLVVLAVSMAWLYKKMI